MFTKLKQFQDLRQQGKKMQSALAEESVTVRTAGDQVVMTLDGNLQMTGLALDDALLSPEKKDRLQSALKEAHADAIKKIQRLMAGKIKDMGGLPKIPGLS